MRPPSSASGRAAASVVCISFSGAGHLATYHLGVGRALLSLCTRNHRPRTPMIFAGSSSGAMAAVACRCLPPDRLEVLATDHASGRVGLWDNLRRMLLEMEEEQQEEEELRRVGGDDDGVVVAPSSPVAAMCSGSVFVAATRCDDGTSHLFSRYRDVDHLMRCVRASARIPRSFHPFDVLSGRGRSHPTYPPSEGVRVDGEYYCDGAIAAAAPFVPDRLAGTSCTVVVSPVSGVDHDEESGVSKPSVYYRICPTDASVRVPFWNPSVAGLSVLPSLDNVRALLRSFHCDERTIMSYHRMGYADGMKFIESQGPNLGLDLAS